MLKRFYKKYKNIIDPLFAFGLIISLCAILFNLGNSIVNKDDDYKKVSLSWEIGGLTSTGKYTETKKSIYTKESFSCDGLKTILDFDSNIKYQVFFYDEKDVFISATEVLTESKEHEVPENAELARIVITPIWGSDVKKDDQVIKWHDNWFLDNKYSKQLTIKVLKEVEKKNDKLEDLDIETLSFNYEVGDSPEYLYFDENFDYSFMESGNKIYKLLTFNGLEETDSNVDLIFGLTSTTDVYDLSLVILSSDGSMFDTLLTFFTYDYRNNEIITYNDEYVISNGDSVLINYSFFELNTKHVFTQNILKKEI